MGGCVLRLAVALGLDACHPFMTKAIFYIKQVSKMSSTNITKVPQLQVTSESAIRLARMLEKMVDNLGEEGQEDDMQFCLMWAQIFRLHGQLKLAHMFVMDFKEYATELAKMIRLPI